MADISFAAKFCNKAPSGHERAWLHPERPILAQQSNAAPRLKTRHRIAARNAGGARRRLRSADRGRVRALRKSSQVTGRYQSRLRPLLRFQPSGVLSRTRDQECARQLSAPEARRHPSLFPTRRRAYRRRSFASQLIAVIFLRRASSHLNIAVRTRFIVLRARLAPSCRPRRGYPKLLADCASNSLRAVPESARSISPDHPPSASCSPRSRSPQCGSSWSTTRNRLAAAKINYATRTRDKFRPPGIGPPRALRVGDHVANFRANFLRRVAQPDRVAVTLRHPPPIRPGSRGVSVSKCAGLVQESSNRKTFQSRPIRSRKFACSDFSICRR